MLRRFMLRAAAVSAVFILVFGCATGPELSSRQVPDWVLKPPESTAKAEYFVASASDPADVASAEEAAGYALLSQINQALGVEISVETSAEARSTLDSFEANLVQQVTQRGSGQVEGLRIADRYITEQGGSFVVYLLGEYERSALEAERSKRQAILREREELVAGPERDGDRAVASGRLSQGILLYSQAASAAASSDVQIAPVVLERALQKAAETGARLELVAVSGPQNALPGVAPTAPVLFRLTDDAGNPVSGASIEISYTASSGNRDVIRTAIRQTGAAGIVSFNLPAPTQVGEASVTARLDTTAILAVLDSLPRSVAGQVRVVEDVVVNVRATYRFAVLSRAREIPTAVVVADLDAGGVPMDGHLVSDGILEALLGAGFQVRTIPVAAGQISGLSQADAVDLLRQRVNADVNRVIFGSASIVEFLEDDGVLVKVSGSVSAVDLTTGEILYTTNGIKNARSRTVDRAVDTAFTELGRQFGQDLASRLP